MTEVGELDERRIAKAADRCEELEDRLYGSKLPPQGEERARLKRELEAAREALNGTVRQLLSAKDTP